MRFKKEKNKKVKGTRKEPKEINNKIKRRRRRKVPEIIVMMLRPKNMEKKFYPKNQVFKVYKTLMDQYNNRIKVLLPTPI